MTPTASLAVHFGPHVVKKFIAASQAANQPNWHGALQQLAANIQKWKLIGPGNVVVTHRVNEFGRDKSNDHPDPCTAWHAHMEPPRNPFKREWQQTNGKPTDERTSPYQLFYSLHVGRPHLGLLVLDVLGPQPNAHVVWGPPKQVRVLTGYARAGKKHQDEGWLPPPDPATGIATITFP